MLHQSKVQIVFLILICSNSTLSQLPTCGKTDDSYLGICSKIDNYTHLQDPEPTPVHVKVVVLIEDLISIDQSAQLINLRLKLSSFWNDPRIALAYSDLNKPKYFPWHFIENEEFELIWKPDVQFLNSISTKLETNDVNDKIFDDSLNQLMWVQSYSVSVSCGMDFSMYPFDHHECFMKLWHIGSSNNVLLDEPEILIEEEVIWQRSSFDISFEPMTSISKEVKTSKVKFNETFSVARIKIELTRKNQEIRSVFVEFWFPNITYSILALISYFISVESVPGRMGLLITLYLIAINTYVSTVQGIFGANMCIDVFFAGSLVPIIFAILEYGALLAIIKFKKGYINGKFINSCEIDKIAFVVSLVYIVAFDIFFFVPKLV